MAEPSEVLFSRYGPGQTLEQTVHLRGVSGTRPQLRRETACASRVCVLSVMVCLRSGCRRSKILSANTFLIKNHSSVLYRALNAAFGLASVAPECFFA